MFRFWDSRRKDTTELEAFRFFFLSCHLSFPEQQDAVLENRYLNQLELGGAPGIDLGLCSHEARYHGERRSPNLDVRPSATSQKLDEGF